MIDSAAGGRAPTQDDGRQLRSLRLWLLASLGLLFVLVMAFAGPLSIDGNRDQGPSLEAILRVVVLAVALPLLMAMLARRVLAPAEELGQAHDRLQRLYQEARLDALIDPITGLGNHRAFQEELERQVSDAQRHRHPLALVLADLDDLKRVNDERGHAGGDELLGAMGRLVVAFSRTADRGFRIGGDEFAILLPRADLGEAEGVVRRLLASALNPERSASVSSRPFSFSAGVSSFPAPAADGRHLVRQADAALYWAKGHGRTDVQVFDPERHGAAADRRSPGELAAAVAAVAEQQLLIPFYQTIYDLRSGAVVGIEALVRPTEDSGFADAHALFSAAEAGERSVELDRVCLGTVAAGVQLPPGDAFFSVNISPRTMETEQFRVSELVALIAPHGIPPSRLVLELTEREAVEDMARLRSNVERCQAEGIRVAADDVGAGSAGLRLLSEIRFDIVKIDLSLVQGGVLRESALAVLKAIRDIGLQSGAMVVAEGIETADQLEVVRALDLAAGQGFLLSPPGNEVRSDALDLKSLLEAHAARRRAMGAWFDLDVAS